MQTIKHTSEYRNLHILMDELELLYSHLSDKNTPLDTHKGLFPLTFDDSLKAIFQLFNIYSGSTFEPLEFEHKDIKPLQLKEFDPKNIIVCYSGGKDSFSVIRHYQKLGYNVYPYHIRGLNKTYYDEWKVAQQAAEKLGLTLYIDSVGYSGQHMWIEHPMKNMIMANMALTWGVQQGITTQIAFGSFRTAMVSDVPFDVCAGDCYDMWELYNKVIQRFIPGFKVHIPNKNFQTAYNALLKEPQYLPYTISCVTPNRFRNLFRERTLRNFPKADLKPNRCGCCWKCAAEYIWFCDHNVLEYDQDYYIHCLEVLLNTVEQETGYLVHSIEYVWDLYFFYPLKKSKAYKELKDATIRARKINITH